MIKERISRQGSSGKGALGGAGWAPCGAGSPRMPRSARGPWERLRGGRCCGKQKVVLSFPLVHLRRSSYINRDSWMRTSSSRSQWFLRDARLRVWSWSINCCSPRRGDAVLTQLSCSAKKPARDNHRQGCLLRCEIITEHIVNPAL